MSIPYRKGLFNHSFASPGFAGMLGSKWSSTPLMSYRKKTIAQRPNRFRKTRKMKMRYKNRKQKSQFKKYEIKYSPAVSVGLGSYTNYIGSLTRLSIDQINAAGNSTPFNILPFIWPTAGTGKQQMIGSRIYIRKLVLTVYLVFDKANWSPRPFRIVVFKSKQNFDDVNFNTIFNCGGSSYPNLYNSASEYMTGGLKNGNGKIIKSKLIKPQTYTTDTTEWSDPSSYAANVKFVIRINKAYEKSARSTGTSMEFNFSNYYLAVLKCETSGYAGIGYTGCNVHAHMTYTDV